MKKSALFTAGTTFALAAAAFAQPAVFTDIGTLTSPSTTTGTVSALAAGQVAWLKVTVPSTVRGLQQFFDITLNGGSLVGGTLAGDTHMGIFDNSGNFIASDDDDGPSAYSQLSFGDASPARAAIAFTGNATANGTTRSGQDGAALPAGTYWIAVAGFGGNTYANGWTVGTTHPYSGDFDYRFELGTDTTAAALGVTAAIAPLSSGGTPYVNGEQVRVAATVTAFNGPPINPNVTVTANLSAIGGSATQTLFDDGTNGDLVAGDFIFSYVQTISATQGATTGTMLVSVADDATHTASATLSGLAISRYGNIGMPTTFTDLGTWSCSGNSGSFTHVDGGTTGPWNDRVRWYKIVLPAAVAGASSGSYVDIFTSNIGSVITDPEFAIFDNSGVKIAEDDQDGADSHSAFSFGQTTPNRPGQGNGVVNNGRDGALAGGTYWIAVGDWNLNFPTTGAANGNWRVTSNDATTTAGLLNLEIRAVTGACTTSPTGSAVATPNNGLVGSNTLLTCTVVPGGNPVSSGLTVNADLTNIGGGAAVAMHDDGLNGDVTAGDNIFSLDTTIGAVGGGAKTINFAIADAESRTGTASTTFTVIAAPGVFTDLGALPCGMTAQTPTLASGEIKWYKFTAPAITASASDWLDIYTTTASTLSSSDTELGIFDNAGTLIVSDDDDGNGFYSVLTFGSTVARTAVDGIVDNGGFNGRDGVLAGGTYWLAVAGYNAAFSNGWTVTTTSTATGDVALFLNTSNATCSTSPTGIGSGGTVNGCGGNVLATVAVTPGATPPSTGITVNLDTTALGGGVVAMNDSGTGGDAVAGDGTYSVTLAVGGGSDATFNLPFVVADAESRSSNGSLSVVRAGTEVGDLPATAQTYFGLSGSTINGTMSASDVDMFAICVADTANFEAGVNNGGASFDSQLFLFNADGTGAAMNDDEPDVANTLQSHMMLNNSLQTTPDPIVLPTGGLYYLAISAYNRDPITSGVATDTIWANTGGLANSFDETWAPNGLTPTLPVVGWTGTTTATGAYTITMVGATTVCPADLSSNSNPGKPDCAVDINDLLYFLVQFEAGNMDLSSNAAPGVQDCATDINDLLFFLVQFEGGC